MTEPPITVLIVDDDPSLRQMLPRMLDRIGLRSIASCGAKDALLLLDREHIDLVLTDLQMPGIGGLGLLAEMRARGIRTPVITMSGDDSEETIAKSFAAGARDFLSKPFRIARLQASIEQALRETGDERATG